jgi:hypothetical protein
VPASAARRTLGRLGRGLLVATVIVAGLGLAVPLIFRGERLARIVVRATSSLCGTLSVDRVQVSATALYDLLLGRATAVAIDGLRLVAADGDEVLAAPHLRGRVAVRRGPWRIDIVEVTATGARWRLVEHAGGRMDLLDAFRPIPAGRTREACVLPPQRSQARRSRPAAAPPRDGGSVPPAVRIHHASLVDLDLLLDFRTWGLALHGTRAEGSLAFDSGAVPPLSFEVHGISAASGGSLRVGTRGQGWAVEVPFDAVEIDRFAVDPAAPAHLVLEVRRATTGRSVLSGRARFTEVFSRAPPGIELDASWATVGDAVEALKRSWGLGRRMPGRLDGDVTAQLQGPYSALAAHLQARGARAELDVRLARDLRIDGSVKLDGIDTAGLLDRSLIPLLGGRLTGEVRAHGQLAPRLQNVAAELDLATLRLDRTRRGPWPRRFVVSTGAAAGAIRPDDELYVFLAGARFARGVLGIDDVRAAVARARLRGAGSVQLLDRQTGMPLPAPFVETSGETRGLDFAQFLPGWPVTGRLSVRGTMRGPSDNLAVRAQFLPDTALRLWGRGLAVPAVVAARIVDGERLVLPRVRLGLPPEGSLLAEGSVVLDGQVAARLAIARFPLAGLPSLPVLGVRVGGWLDAGLRLSGLTVAPALAGEIALSDVTVAGVVLGSGGVTIAPARDGLRIEGRLVPSLGVVGRLLLGASPTVAANLELNGFALGPLLARIAPGVQGQISGTASIDANREAYAMQAVLADVAVAFDTPVPGGPRVSLRNDGPVKVRAADGRITLAPVQLHGPGLELGGQGTLDDAGVRADGRARVILRSWSAALRPWLREADGSIELAVHAEGPLPRPALSGSVRAVDTLRLWAAPMLVPLEVTGEVAFAGATLQAQRLTASLAGATMIVDGQAVLAASDWFATRLDARLTGALDGATLARRLPFLVTQAHGSARLSGHLGGTAGAPIFDGEAVFAGLGGEVIGLPAQINALDGRLEGRGHTLSTQGLTVSLAPGGTLVVGSPAAPAVFDLASLYPLLPGHLDVPLHGRDLAALAPIAGLRVDDLNLDVRLSYDPGSPLRVTGDIWIDAAAFTPSAPRRPPGATMRTSARLARSLFPAISLDLAIHAPRGGLEVRVPHLPDVALTLDCRLRGSARAPRLTGQARGSGLYSRVAVFFYDVFSGAHVRRCGARD